MSKKSQARRRVLTTGAAVCAAVAMPRLARAAAPIKLKYGTNVNIENPLNVRLNEAFTRIRTQTNGAVDIQLFPDGQLGSDTEMLSQLRSGALDMFTLSSVILSRLVPECAIVGVGFAFPSYKEIWAAMDGDLGAALRDRISAAGLFCQEKVWDLSFKEITSSAIAVRKPEDLKGFKLRVPPGRLWISLFEAFGASPTTINMNEIYSALQTRVVDGTELPLTTFYFAKLYEVQKSVSLTRHMWDGWLSLVNKATWDQIPADLRAVVSRNLNESALAQRADVVALEARFAGVLAKDKKMQVIEVDPKPFRVALRQAGYYEEWKKRFGPDMWALLEKYAGHIG
ncbi:TRAP transporter substrate-binding protein [Burkholderia sp. PAMC 26561]|uniref:TRAP transporter substrate-binding protein n=1 Tax=Burkholderia sp. PAMC 26561 TaxID=1795043 RepID=UPI00076B51DB|nr:TRAP transporter substrate-binding protein [Burkholderia sp. PAMC 26561]AME26953.1 hypothetical protein AXG89_23560 [Burkholderia sp. PAMC 26561]AME27901.1 hypothetical protein AXG89_29125 [Burkholderia sp. PAMC 26561]